MVTAIAIAARPESTAAQSPSPPDPAIKFIAVALPDITLYYPSNLPSLADEHTTIIPPSTGSGLIPPPPGEDSYLFFASSDLTGGNSGAVVLETRDLINFDFAWTRGYEPQVMAAPIAFQSCDPSRLGEFDLNYAGPGSVVADPTRPSGSLLMFFEAENHCPDGTDWQREFYATVGYARSIDFGRSWPAPVNAIFGGKNRHPVLKLATPEPTTLQTSPAYMGNAIPSAFVDRDEHGLYYVYVTYIAPQGPNAPSDGLLRVARARLGGDDRGPVGDDSNGDEGHHRMRFTKWYNGAFTEPGIGGLDSGPLAARGCQGVQADPSISRIDDLDRYLLTYVCVDTVPQADGMLHAGWFYSTATSLDKEDWTQPRLIINSDAVIVEGCNPKDGSGRKFDGWYPSFMTPHAMPGHLGLSGAVYFMGGCDTGARVFTARNFAIAPGP
jgi:hypothetical protein